MTDINQKLTLPIQVGKKYIRRDGAVAEITPTEYEDTVESNGDRIWKANGKVLRHGACQYPEDIVADYVEISESIPNSKQAHPHAELMMEYAKDAATMAEPWVNWEYNTGAWREWRDLTKNPDWFPRTAYRRKQPKVIINGIECNAGVEVANFDELYYIPSLVHPDLCLGLRYTGADKRQLQDGLLHKTKEDAVAMAKAMLAFKPCSTK